MSPDDQGGVSSRIELPDDTLVLDRDFCREVLGGVTRRTAFRFETDGLPFVMIGGRKYRPLNEGRAWLAKRIVRKQQRRAR